MDIGTCFLVSARSDEGNKTEIKSIRDAFIDMENDPRVKNMMKMSGVNFIEDEEEEKLYIVGDPAVVMANIFNKEARRPLSKGFIAPGELEAEKILKILLKNVLGNTRVENETCYYSVPAAPVDQDVDVVYHQAMFSKLIGSLGYKPVALNEAAAITYSNCAKEKFSALTISCLVPGQKIITDKGFRNIEDIHKGNKVLTKEGRWVSATPTSRPYEGEIFKIKSYGQGSIEVTGEHKIWIMRDGVWGWVEAKEVIQGDFVKQPWVNFDFSERPYICYDERITCSKPKETAIHLTAPVIELIGFFLGDGGIEVNSEGKPAGVNFTLDKKYPLIIERVEDLIADIFDKEAAQYEHTGNGVRLKFYSRGFATWLKDSCYDKEGEKKFPWDIAKLSDNYLRFLLKGLIESDGEHADNTGSLCFGNTSPYLAQLVYLITQRLGMNPSFYFRGPRKGGVIEGRQIEGKKEEFKISSGNIDAKEYMEWLKNPVCSSKKACNHGSSVGVVGEVESYPYKGTVYDVSVEGNDHSFCVPGIAVHNCGAGMVNVCLMYQTMIGMSFSIQRGGDFIDQSACQATGTTASRIQSIKEKGLNLMDPSEGDIKTFREREAISIYYKSLILYALETIKTEFKKREGTIELPYSIPIVLSGGTSLAKNFKEFFETGFNAMKDKFPIPISEIRMATDPLNAVAQGLLVAAANYDEGEQN